MAGNEAWRGFNIRVAIGIVALLMMGGPGAATEVSGAITSDTTWTLSNSPYIVVGDVVVNSGITLTIEPGVVVKYNSSNLQINGTLIARGTSNDPIVFTSNKTTPVTGDWGYIFFDDSSTDATYDVNGNYMGGSILEYCLVEYAGGVSVSDNGAVRMNNAHPFINYCIIRNNKASGIMAWDMTEPLKITNNTISNNIAPNSGGGIYVSGGTTTIYNNTIINNKAGGGGGGGIAVINNIATISNNILSNNNALGGTYYYYSGSDGGGGIYVSGGMTAISNNTINNNMASLGGGGIYIYNGAQATILNNSINRNTAEAQYGGGNSGGGIGIHSATATISNNNITNNIISGDGGGISVYSSTVTISNNIISNNKLSSGGFSYGGGGGIIVFFYSSATIINNFISENTALYSKYDGDPHVGGGIYIYYATAIINNNSIVRNSALNASAVYYSYGDNQDFKYNTISGNIATGSSPTYTGYISSHPLFNNNNIFNNIATYELWNANAQGSPNMNAMNNWWGTTSDSAIQAKIYDWFDDSSKGIVDYSPYLSTPDITGPISSPQGLIATGGDSVITLSWFANQESDLAGYKVYYDTNSGYPYEGTGANEGNSGIDIGNVTDYQLSGLIKGIKYYVAITAYDVSGDESWYSQACATPKVGAIFVPDYHSKIQRAVDNACAGDTIIVRDGTYIENVDVNNKDLTIRSENGSAKTIVQAENPDDHIFEVTADYVNISGFTLTGANGIRLEGTSNNTISNNIFLNNGIVLHNSKNNLILNNEISGTSWDGVVLSYSGGNIISNNKIKDKSGSGFFIDHSFDNVITHNIIDNNGRAGSDHGGIGIDYSERNIISDNNISNNGFSGVRFLYSNNNNITNNLIQNHNYGIYWRSGDHGNTIFLNDFVSNSVNNGGVETYNSWNSPQPITYTYNGSEYISKLGNYWSDYAGSDLNGNGIGDTAYSISGNDDNYPLIRLSEGYTLIPSTTELIMNETASINHTLFESIFSQNATLNTSVNGDLNGTLNFTNLEFVYINSGSFAGKGFSKGYWMANIEGNPHEGYWQGMLFKKPEERKIYLKGMVSGGLKGIVEGYLIESVNGSDVYDQYQAKWTVNQIGADIVFAEIDLNGTIIYQESAEYSSEVYALQTSIEGKASGHYNGSLSVVLTHVRIDNETKPYYGQGFSIISYVSEYGAGEGWTYDKLVSPGRVEMKGLFTSPLMGIVSASLEETKTPRSLSLLIERIDIGLPPAPDLKVKVWGPRRISPGQTVDYIIEYRNDGLKAAENMAVILFPSLLTYYISASPNNIYDEIIHTIRWNLTHIPPKSVNILYYKGEVMWGLQEGEFLIFAGNILSQENADELLQHDTPRLTYTLRRINEWMRATLEGFWQGIMTGTLTGISELIGVTEIGPPGIYTTSELWAKDKMWKMSPENAYDYWKEVLNLLNDLNSDPTFIKDKHPGEDFYGLVEELAKKYGLPDPTPYPRFESDFRGSATTARDPNIKYGPEGFVLPSQKLNYAVEFENEGEGIAFGVYFTDTLDEDLDTSTLEIGTVLSTKDGSIIAPAGTYNPSTRTITWLVGEVGSREGGYANLSVNVRNDAEEGTEIINYATVYFPSVPETTRTNGIVSVVDITPPRYSNVNQNKSVVTAGEVNEVYAYWQDGVQLNYTWLETNESGTWQTVSFLKLSGSEAWSNFTIHPTKEGVACWRILANDTAGNENSTPMLCFDVQPSLDAMPPLSVTEPGLLAAGATWLNFTWNNPPDADFSHVMLYLNGSFITNVYAPQNFYNVTSLSPDTFYELSTHTVDTSGNINETWVNATARTLSLPDTVPPASVDLLHNITYAQTYINWTWTDPADSDFANVSVWIDGVFKDNIQKAIQFYNATGFVPDTEHTIATRTIDINGNINQTWKNHTARTAPEVIITPVKVKLTFIVTENHLPIAKATVQSGGNFRGETNETGTVTFEVPLGVYKYAVREKGYVRATGTVNVADETTVNVKLTPRK